MTRLIAGDQASEVISRSIFIRFTIHEFISNHCTTFNIRNEMSFYARNLPAIFELLAREGAAANQFNVFIYLSDRQ